MREILLLVFPIGVAATPSTAFALQDSQADSMERAWTTDGARVFLSR